MIKLPDRLIDHDAIISNDGRYRYWLKRTISVFGVRPVVFIMLNPSTADAVQDDPTIRRCIGYAENWNARDLIVVNLFALRATDPRFLWYVKTVDPVGQLNDDVIRYALDYSRLNNGITVAAWGEHGDYMERGDTVRGWGWKLQCLKKNKSGQPAHPLYLPKSLNPIPLGE